MQSRREFLKRAALVTGTTGVAGGFPAVLQRALAIDPAPGSTWLDAEHVVILMQENRSFDHCYGALRGVRGFRDPRAVALPDGNPVWLQSNRAGETYAPFRLDIHDTKATWMSSLPHSWADQTDARHEGRHDGWLEAKRSGNEDYARMPLTLGCYDRRDLPFYYALADAFTVCDQNFCSSLTGTTPNRLHLWTGTIRARPSTDSKANVRNQDVDYGSEASWTTFPERLEAAGVSWRIYQNEISLDSGLRGEADAWLANFTDNPVEWFTQYHVRFANSHRTYLAERVGKLPGEIGALEASPSSASRDSQLAAAQAELAAANEELKRFTDQAFAALTPTERSLHERAFTTNAGDAEYRKLTTLKYQDDGRPREMRVPAGDVLHQFRSDVQSGKLPAVSWIVAPENFSDHPGAPWYGAWYLSECLDILTKNPEVWRKTIFVLCYDENDGYFDHVPPFVPPDPANPETGKVSAGLDPSSEWVRKWQEDEFERRHPGAQGRTGPIGLGFRVPLVIASPWSRGGYVNSQVFDHTSIVRMLEVLFSHRTGRAVRESNISPWRRAVCGDLSTVFRPFSASRVEKPKPLERDPFLESIHQAQFRPLPTGYRSFSTQEIAEIRSRPNSAPWRSLQEDGTRPSSALPYELSVDGRVDPPGTELVIRFGVGRELFGDRSLAAPFHVYAPVPVRVAAGSTSFNPGRTWAYTVLPGDQLPDTWRLADFQNGQYHLRVHGPNGFFRELRGTAQDPRLDVSLRVTREGAGMIRLQNDGSTSAEVIIRDLSYGRPRQTVVVPAGGAAAATVVLDLSGSHGWYDYGFEVAGSPEFSRRYAGRIETGQDSTSDPAMGSLRG